MNPAIAFFAMVGALVVAASVISSKQTAKTELPFDYEVIVLPNSSSRILVIDHHYYLESAGGVMEMPPIISRDGQ